MTQQQAADKSGLGSRQRWNDVEGGRTPNLTLASLEAIAAALGVSVCDLIIEPKKSKR